MRSYIKELWGCNLELDWNFKVRARIDRQLFGILRRRLKTPLQSAPIVANSISRCMEGDMELNPSPLFGPFARRLAFGESRLRDRG
jgi:hypothetical protein